MFGALDISTSGLVAQRTRLDTIANNIASADVTRAKTDASGRAVPYRRQVAMFAAATGASGRPAGVRVSEIVDDLSPFRKSEEPNPTHRDAAADGYVYHPNVSMAVEQVNMLEATRAYEANITAIEATKAMLAATLRLLA
jgi:flagellar basal-body rod protein FlgC